MRVKKIEKLAKSEETVEMILSEVRDSIKIVDETAKKLKRDISDNPQTIRTLLSKVTGAHSDLKTAWGVVDTAKTNTQLDYYFKVKNTHDTKKDGKFNSTATKEEARALVQNYRRIRNYLQAYVESASQDISTLQSLKKKTEQEFQTSGE